MKSEETQTARGTGDGSVRIESVRGGSQRIATQDEAVMRTLHHHGVSVPARAPELRRSVLGPERHQLMRTQSRSTIACLTSATSQTEATYKNQKQSLAHTRLNPLRATLAQ